jgi:hypothetical protein
MRNPFSREGFGQTPDPSAYGVGQGQSAPAAVVADDRVRQALDAIGYGYSIGNDFKTFYVTIRYPDTGRSQSVQVESATQSDLGPPWRRIWSESFGLTGRLTWEKALALLADNDRRTFGAWTVAERDGQTKVWFRVSIPADSPPPVLKEAILMAAWAADEMERATTGEDIQ